MKPTNKKFEKLLFLSIFFVSSYSYSDEKHDLYKQARAAMNEGKVFQARDAFCHVASKYPGYKDAQMQCKDMRTAAQKVINFHNKRYLDAVQAMYNGKLDDAEAKLKLVKYGDFVEDAKARLAEIQQLRKDKTK